MNDCNAQAGHLTYPEAVWVSLKKCFCSLKRSQSITFAQLEDAVYVVELVSGLQLDLVID